MQKRFFQLLTLALDSWDGKCNFVNHLMSYRCTKRVHVDKQITKKFVMQMLDMKVSDILSSDERFLIKAGL